MVTRTRVENFSETYGTAFRKLTGSTTTRRRTLSKDTIVDVVVAKRGKDGSNNYTPSHDAQLSIEKLQVTGGIMNGKSAGGDVFTNYPIDAINGYPYFHLNFANRQSNSYYATKIAAETNPSEPLVDVGQTFSELGNVPKLIKNRGRTVWDKLFGAPSRRSRRRDAVGAAADLNLRFQFGIKPLVNDLIALIGIKKATDQRVRDLIKSEKAGGLVKKRDVFRETRRESDSGILLFSAFGAGSTIYAKRDIVTNSHVWVYCRWVPDGTRKLPYSEDRQFHRGFGDFLGVNPFNFRNIWNSLPWSWLVDWSFNVGDYLSATNNTVGLKLAACCVCSTTTTTITWTITSGLPKGVTCSPCVRKHTSKSRLPTKLDIAPKKPFLTAGQIGILASLVGR